MTTLSQIELSCSIRSIVRAAAARQAARDARLDTETVEVMYSLTPETVAAENRNVGRGERSMLTYQTSDRRVTRIRPVENHSYSRCA